MANRKTTVLCARIEAMIDAASVDRILVVGCGDGTEAVVLADHFGAEVTGIDLDGRFDRRAAATVDLRIMDATALTFDDHHFDLVYSFHALEHIADPEAALAEMRRVLRPNGAYCIGTPNRTRLVGYIGSTTDLATKIRWNLNDFRMRLLGRWRNEDGAHAGFSRAELDRLCRDTFGQASEISDEYYRHLYPSGRTGALVDRVAGTRLAPYLFPCVYVRGHCVETSADRAPLGSRH